VLCSFLGRVVSGRALALQPPCATRIQPQPIRCLVFLPFVPLFLSFFFWTNLFFPTKFSSLDLTKFPIPPELVTSQIPQTAPGLFLSSDRENRELAQSRQSSAIVGGLLPYCSEG